MIEIRLPSALAFDQPGLLAQGLEPCLSVPPGDRLTLDLTDLSRTSAFGVAALASRLVWLIRTRRMPSGSTIRRPELNRVGNDLMRMGLYRLIQEGSEQIYRIDPVARPQELWLVDRPEDLAMACDRLCLLLRGVLPLDEEVYKKVSGMMQALGQNVFRHAQSPSGAMVCGQVYPKSGVLELAVADTGVGILGSLKRHAPLSQLNSDSQAIRTAFHAKVAVPNSEPRPCTLSALMATAKMNKGEMVALSGRASATFRMGELSFQNHGNFPGTVIGMKLLLAAQD